MKRSFRWRLLVALCLWSIGLFILVHGVSPALFERLPFLASFSHGVGLFVLAAGFMVAGFTFGGRGVARFTKLRDALAAVRSGRATRVEGEYPSEVQPLVDDLNALLIHRDRVVQRAKAKASDLAHGLKTPLALLAHEAEDARKRGHLESAREIAEQVERMRRHVDYHLAQARAAASGVTPGVHCAVLEATDGLVRVLRRLHADRGLTIDINVQPEHVVRCQREDVDEMLGNVLDNACKWASQRVFLASAAGAKNVTITVDDDGSGLESAKRELVMSRGVRADETTQGTGLGLAIVRDLADLYGGSVTLDDSPLGGLQVRVDLPAA
jgi:signal transduction histidine kinase